MKTFLLILTGIVCGCPSVLFAQYESLEPARRQIILRLPSVSARVDTLNEWAFQTDGEPSQRYARLAFTVATQVPYPKGQAESLVRLGQAATHLGKPGEAEQYYRQALPIRSALRDTVGMASCYNNLGNLKSACSRYDSALLYFRLGLQVMKGHAPHINLAKLHSSYGGTLRLVGQYDSSLYHLRQSLAVYEQLKSRSTGSPREIMAGIAAARMNQGALLQDNLNQYDAARDLLQQSLHDFEALQHAKNTGKCRLLLGNNAYYAGRLEEALDWYSKALDASSLLSAYDRAAVLKNRGRIYLEQKVYGRALQEFEGALDSFKNLEVPEEIARTYFETGNVYYEQDDLQRAVTAYEQALGYQPRDPVLHSRLLYFLPKALDRLGRHEQAALYTKRYIDLLTGLDTARNQTALSQLMQYQLQKDRLADQLHEKEKQELWTYGLIGLGILGLLLGIALLAWRINRQKRRIAEQANQLITQEKLDLLRDLELETYSAWLEGQEATQQKIGRELHDGLGSLLSTVKLHFASVETRLDKLQDENRSQYDKAHNLLEHACQEVRRISHELASALLMKFGLKPQLEALADAIESSGKLEVELATFGLEERLDNKTEINVYRMIQILTHNVIEHANAEKITISVNRFKDLLNIIVEDNGQGFRQEDVRLKPGLGMKSLAARVHDLEGVLNIDPRPGQGTLVSIDLPIVNNYAPSFASNN